MRTTTMGLPTCRHRASIRFPPWMPPIPIGPEPVRSNDRRIKEAPRRGATTERTIVLQDTDSRLIAARLTADLPTADHATNQLTVGDTRLTPRANTTTVALGINGTRLNGNTGGRSGMAPTLCAAPTVLVIIQDTVTSAPFPAQGLVTVARTRIPANLIPTIDTGSIGSRGTGTTGILTLRTITTSGGPPPATDTPRQR